MLGFLLVVISLSLIKCTNERSNDPIPQKVKDRNPSYPPFSFYTPMLLPIKEDEPFEETDSDHNDKVQSDLEQLIAFFSDKEIEQIFRNTIKDHHSVEGLVIKALTLAKSPEMVETLLTHPYFGVYRLINSWDNPNVQAKLFSYLKQIMKHAKHPVTDKWLLRMAVILTFKEGNKKLRQTLLQHPVNPFF